MAYYWLMRHAILKDVKTNMCVGGMDENVHKLWALRIILNPACLDSAC